MTDTVNATVVTAGDRAYAWGALMLVASMRRNGMGHPVVVGAMDWTEEQKRRIAGVNWRRWLSAGARNVRVKFVDENYSIAADGFS